MRISRVAIFTGAGFIAASIACSLALAQSRQRSEKTLVPTKDAAVNTLRQLLDAFEKGDYDRALSLMQVPVDTPPNKFPKDMRDPRRGVHRSDLSAHGITLCAEKGSWIKLTELTTESSIDVLEAKYGIRFRKNEIWTPESMKMLEAHYNVSFNNLYGLFCYQKHNSRALFYWNGKKFKVIIFDDITERSLSD